ncbi:uncharacterized protein VICG_01510 [Vittaforma corneae ATCC 50505]|uniref:Uncharacterized protein n=1 Tax=Vittaforma corneae (strain ATCC 50505) TaxID=993615 RepID=L2GLM2_VITCO|nr:uncharacterized protein VICG_01510 [Vittaforma corneae ATCC 50505]ELA41405.1 hypothetical protein VICG_01510 [Vittaforma corneae ATCC 50505]
MVVRKITLDKICSSSYDDLDAVNDYILACEEDDVDIKAISEENDQDKKVEKEIRRYKPQMNEELEDKCTLKQTVKKINDNANVEKRSEDKTILTARSDDLSEIYQFSAKKQNYIAKQDKLNSSEREQNDAHESILACVSTESNIYSITLFDNSTTITNESIEKLPENLKAVDSEQDSLCSLKKVCEMLNEQCVSSENGTEQSKILPYKAIINNTTELQEGDKQKKIDTLFLNMIKY